MLETAAMAPKAQQFEKHQFRVLFREFRLRVIDLELLSADGDPTKLLGQFASPAARLQLPRLSADHSARRRSHAARTHLDHGTFPHRHHHGRRRPLRRPQLGLGLSRPPRRPRPRPTASAHPDPLPRQTRRLRSIARPSRPCPQRLRRTPLAHALLTRRQRISRRQSAPSPPTGSPSSPPQPSSSALPS